MEEDRISKLPDPIVHHIFSFLPIKSVVSTSILSKRWKNVWVSIPVLDFRSVGPTRVIFTRYQDYDEQATITETNKFMDFMDRVLIQCNMLNIKKFCLNCENGYFDPKRVNSWITMAMQCDVEELIFSGCYSYSINGKMIPESLFTCESLTTLDYQIAEQDLLDLPESISLPRLKILRLSNFVYHDEELVGKLFSSCPVLEELCLTSCRWLNFDCLCISAPRLKSFTLTGCLTSNMEHVKLEIDAPNLMSFNFSDWLPKDLVVDSFPLLYDAAIYFRENDVENRSGRFYNFIMKLCNVKLLKITSAYFKILEQAKVLLSKSFPTFGNLIRLEVYDIDQMKPLLNFLELSPNLESVVIDQVHYMGGENVSTFKVVPQCLVVSLKSIEIRKFTGYLEMVKFVLKHGRVLQTVIIDDYKTEAKWVEASNNSLMTILRQTPWASASCVIKFLSNHGTCCEFRL